MHSVARVKMHHRSARCTYVIGFLLHSVNLIQFTVLASNLILYILPHHSLSLHSNHASPAVFMFQVKNAWIYSSALSKWHPGCLNFTDLYPEEWTVLARVFATATCPSVSPSRAGIVKTKKASVIIYTPSGSPTILVL